jgi:hypothetical protein
MIATHRWTLDGRKLKLASGATYTFPKRTPKPILDALRRLPQDYLDLGNRSADLDADLQAAERAAEGWKLQFEDLMTKVTATEGKDEQQLLVILQKDLETALNLCNRLIWTVGAQPGGALYEAVNVLMRKYGMALTPNTEMADAKSPYVEQSEHEVALSPEHYGTEVPERAVVRYNPRTGRMDFEPIEESDAEMQWDNEGGNGGNREWLSD